jgi:hypothetical protein
MSGDEIRISTKNGLHHFRSGKLLNTYKIIPQKVQEEYDSTCPVPPCQPKSRERVYYFLEPFKKYIAIDLKNTDYSFKLSRQDFSGGKDDLVFRNGDMAQYYLLRKL